MKVDYDFYYKDSGSVNKGHYVESNEGVSISLSHDYTTYDKTFHVNSSSNNAKYLTFYGRKAESTRNSNFGDYLGDIRL